MHPGYLVATGWQLSICSTAFPAGTIIQGLLVLNQPKYTYEQWHGTLLFIAVAVLAILFNIFLAKRLPLVERVLLVIYIIGFFAIIIPIWTLAPLSSADVVFTEFTNEGGWATVGTATLIGLSAMTPTLAGFDCVVHMG